VTEMNIQARDTDAGTLVAEGMTKSYGPNVVLDSVTVRLAPGTITGLVGHNGAGKSTLLRCLSGAERPEAGQISAAGVPLSLTSPSAALDAGIACVYQELSLVDCLTVAQNVFLGTESSRHGVLSKSQMGRATADLIDEFGIGAKPDDLVSDLSVAQRQLVEVAAAIRRDVRYLLLDEPTTALEPHQVQRLLSTVKTLAETRGLAVLLVNHKLDEVFAVADSVLCLANGRVVLDRSAVGLDRSEVVRAIVGRDPMGGHLGRERMTLGRDAGSEVPRASGPVLLEARNLTANRLKGVSLSVHAGEIMGIYGLMGSGRSRFLRTVACDEPRTGGQLLLNGQPVTFTTIKGAMKAGLAYVPEERKANGYIPVFDSLDNAALPVLDRFRRLGFIGRKSARAEAATQLGKFSIRGSLTRPTPELSGGNQQKVLFGRAAMQEPRVLLLDEPTKGVDIGAKAEIHTIIRNMVRQKGVAVLLVSSEEEELLDLADRICVFTDGSCDGVTYDAATLPPGRLRSLAWAAGSRAATDETKGETLA
jgi:ABC-type sugar transport system ATPase subunit